MYVQVDAACALVMSVDVEEVAYPSSPDCPEPGEQVCVSPLYEVNLPEVGGWILNIPIECTCLTFGKTYMLGAYIQSATCEFYLGIDNSPTNCTNWSDWRAGKIWLPNTTFPATGRGVVGALPMKATKMAYFFAV
jgi:hypothetical protein